MPDFDFGDFLNGIGQAKDNTIGALGSALRVLDKPRGAVGALLSGKTISEGWDDPTSIKGRDYYGIRNISNPRLRDIAGTGAEIVLDPLNLAPGLLPVKAVKAARRLGPLGALLEPIAGTQAGVVKRVGAEVATGLSARLGAEGAQAALDQTPLPEGVKNTLSLGAGFLGAGLTAGRFRPKGIVSNIDSAARQVEMEAVREAYAAKLMGTKPLSQRADEMLLKMSEGIDSDRWGKGLTLVNAELLPNGNYSARASSGVYVHANTQAGLERLLLEYGHTIRPENVGDPLLKTSKSILRWVRDGNKQPEDLVDDYLFNLRQMQDYANKIRASKSAEQAGVSGIIEDIGELEGNIKYSETNLNTIESLLTPQERLSVLRKVQMTTIDSLDIQIAGRDVPLSPTDYQIYKDNLEVLDAKIAATRTEIEQPSVGIGTGSGIRLGFAQDAPEPLINTGGGMRVSGKGRFVKDEPLLPAESLPVPLHEGPIADQLSQQVQARARITAAIEADRQALAVRRARISSETSSIEDAVLGTNLPGIDPVTGNIIAPVSRGLDQPLQDFAGTNPVHPNVDINETPEVITGLRSTAATRIEGLPGSTVRQGIPPTPPGPEIIGDRWGGSGRYTVGEGGQYFPSTGEVNKPILESVLDEKALPIGTPPEGLDPVTLEQINQQIYAKLGVEKPTQDLIDLFIQGAVKAGKQDPNWIARGNNILRGMWATADGSWFGIQGLLTLPRLIAKGDFKDAADVFSLSFNTLVGNKKAFTKYLERVMTNIPEGAPDLLSAQKSGLHLAVLQGNADFDFNLIDRLTHGHINPDAAFAVAGDVARISMFYNEYARYAKGYRKYGVVGPRITEDVDLTKLSRAINRATGIAEKPFGGYIGTFGLFAPRFFQSQLETVSKALTDGSIEGTLARRQLGSLIGSGVMLSWAANELRGYNSDEDRANFWNPTHSNFMRIRDIAGEDVSVFGPWDSLVKLVAHLSTGDVEYARTKFSPLLTVAYNAMRGTTFMGDDFKDPGTFARSMLLPFAWQDVGTGRETIPGSMLGFFGVKSSTLSPSEKRDANMRNLGLDPNDPIQRRQYIAEHPEQVRTGLDANEVKLNEVTQGIKQRAAMNDALTIGNAQTLVEFKDKRKLLNRERRNALSLLLNNQDFKTDTQEKRWIQTYFDMLNSAQDPVTHDINSDLVDNLESKWLADNGDKAYDYVQRYLLIDKNPAERQYLEDMNKLRGLGYFDKPKYTTRIYKLTAGLTDDQIESYRDRVSAARFIDPRLGKIPFSRAARRVLTGLDLTNLQIAGIIAAGSDDALNPEVNRIKKQYPHLLAWNNPSLKFQDRLALEPKQTSLRIPSLVGG